jgi:hypothetical protein
MGSYDTWGKPADPNRKPVPEPSREAIHARAVAIWNARRAQQNMTPAPFPPSRADFLSLARSELINEQDKS